MEEPPSQILFVLALLIILSGFFSGSEAALLSIGRAKVRALREQKRRGSKALEWLKNHPKRLIITILVGNNIVNVLISVLATFWATKAFGSHVLGIVTGILTLLILVFGEIIPKNMGQLHNEKFSLFVAPILRILSKCLFPIVWTLEKFSDSMVSKKKQDPITEDEVLAMVSLGAEGGAIEDEEKELIENVLEFTDTITEEVMTPRTTMEVMESDTTLAEAIDFFITYSHSRIPIYEDTIDNIIGILTMKQALKAWKQNEKNKILKNLDLKKPLFIPTTKKIANVFRSFQLQRIHMGIAVDEHGGTAGIITMEDILEEVFGEIIDETDIDDVPIKKIAENAWIVLADIHLHDLEDRIGIVLDTQDSEKTISRFLLEKHQDIPERGEIIELANVRLVVEKMDGHKIEKVRILKK